MKIKEAVEVLKKHNEWRRGAEIDQMRPILIGEAIDIAINQLSEMSLKEAYEILKQNVRYSSGTCPGFVYLSQIEELLK